MAGHTEVLAPVLVRNADRRPSIHGEFHHSIVHAFGVHVDFDFASAIGDAAEDQITPAVFQIRKDD